MRLGLLWAGRTHDRNIRAAIEGYLERISRYVPVQVLEVKEESASDRHGEVAARRRECKRLREKIPAGHEVVVLDPRGREMTSEEFAGFLQRRLDSSSSAMKGLTFMIGGHMGLDDETRRTGQRALALSRMTLTHEMARLVVVEQIYRGLSILRGSKYHRP